MLDESEIREFLAHDYGRVVAAVALASGSRPIAEEAVQEALIKAWAGAERIEALSPWVTKVALNHCRSVWRRWRVERRATDRMTTSSVHWQPGPTPDSVDLEHAFGALPPRQREVAVLRLLLRVDTSETARTLGISEGAVKMALVKARKSLADSLEDRSSEVDDVEA